MTPGRLLPIIRSLDWPREEKTPDAASAEIEPLLPPDGRPRGQVAGSVNALIVDARR